MKVGLVTRHRGLPVGFGTYAGELIDALERHHPEHEFVVYEPRRVPKLRSALVAWELTTPAVRASADRVDVLHYLYPAFPAVHPRMPVVVSVLDVIAFVLPGYELPGPYARLERRAGRRADRVITISRSARDDIARVHAVPPERIDVTELGAPPLEPAAGERGDYFLFVGGTERRKGLRSLLEAFRSADLGDTRLKVVGSHEPSVLFDSRADLPDAPRVDWLGPVGASKLDDLYRHALALVFPSSYEGFGLPVVEAMARRTPVIASRASSIPEVAGDAAILVEPGDVDGLRDALQRVRADDGLRARLAEAGARQVEQFTWEQTAAKTVASYDAALRRRSDSSNTASIRSA